MPLYIKSPVASRCNVSTSAFPEPPEEHEVQSESQSSQTHQNVANEFELVNVANESELVTVENVAEEVEVSPLPRFAMVRCSARKAQEILLKQRNTDDTFPKSTVSITTPVTLKPGEDVNPRTSGHALVRSKVSPTALKLMVNEVQKDVAGLKLRRTSSTSAGHRKVSPPLGQGHHYAKLKSPIRKPGIAQAVAEAEPKQISVVSSTTFGQEAANNKNQRFQLTDSLRNLPLRTPIGNAASITPIPSNSTQRFHSTNPFLNNNDDPMQEALFRLQSSAHTLFQKMNIHPATLRQVLRWDASASRIPVDSESTQQLFIRDSSNCASAQRSFTATPALSKLSLPPLNLERRLSSAYFPNISGTPLPCRRAYKYLEPDCGSEEVKVKVVTSTPKFLLDIRESISDISLVPIVSSTIRSSPSSGKVSERAEVSESDISETEPNEEVEADKIRELPSRRSLPVLRSKMKKIMRTLSDMNAVPEVMDILIDSLPPIVKISPDQLQQLEDRRRCTTAPADSVSEVVPGQSSSQPATENTDKVQPALIEKKPAKVPAKTNRSQRQSVAELSREKSFTKQDMDRSSTRWIRTDASASKSSKIYLNDLPSSKVKSKKAQ